MSSPRLEVHEHSFISGGRHGRVAHSHEGGNVPHQHEHTGPASYTIDKDDWHRATGLRGGGRKKFTAKPTGEQFPIRDLEDWQKSFEVVVVGPPSPHIGTGPGIAPAVRMIKQFGMTARVRDDRRVG